MVLFVAHDGIAALQYGQRADVVQQLTAVAESFSALLQQLAHGAVQACSAELQALATGAGSAREAVGEGPAHGDKVAAALLSTLAGCARCRCTARRYPL